MRPGGRARRGAAAVAILAALAAAGCAGCRIASVRPLEETAAPGSGGAPSTVSFDAAAFVDSIWRSEVLRSLDGARGVEAIVSEAASPAGVSGGGRAPVVVRGSGRVVDVDTRSRSGTATLELDGKQRLIVVVLIGPVLTGTAIRDALPALGFDRFVNQIQHADVGNELNARVERELLRQLDRARLRGRHVRFAGMASVEEGRPLTVTPVRLEVETTP
jgi:predicted lipoprotein